jgi:HK97 family phage major capsid protein
MDKKPFEIRKTLSEKVDKFENLAAKDQRSAEENAEMTTLRGEIRALVEELDNAEALEAGRRRVASDQLSKKEQREVRETFSFLKAIRQAKDGKLDGIEKEMHDEAKREAEKSGMTIEGVGIPAMVLELSRVVRAAAGQNVTTAADGGNWVQEGPITYVDALKAAMVLRSIGVPFIGGLVGDFPIVRNGAFTSTWHSETGSVVTSKAATDKITGKPKRISVSGANSLQVINQTSRDVEMWLRNELISAHAIGLETAAIMGTGANDQPTGLLNTLGIGSVVGGVDGLAPAWSHIVELETKIAILNADMGALAYLTNAKVRGKLKQTLKAANVPGYIWSDGSEMNGYKAAVTNLVPSNLVKGQSGAVCSAILFGNFNDLLVLQWGGLDLVVDPYTLKKSAEIEVTVHAFHDVQLRRTESFAAMKDALTA